MTYSPLLFAYEQGRFDPVVYFSIYLLLWSAEFTAEHAQIFVNNIA